MQTGVCSARHLSRFVSVLIVLSAFGFTADAQATPPLQRFRNYFVTGDYVVAGWQKQSNDGTYSSGYITVPDTTEAATGVPTSVPVGADIVAAYLYWETVESSKTTLAGQVGYFNGVRITGAILGNPNSPSSWSSGGCAGDNSGSKTIRAYRADVRPYLNLNNPSGTLGFTASPVSFTVKLADTGANQQPFTLGASLVIVYRILSPSLPLNTPNVPLNAITIFDGSYNPSNTSTTMQQTIDGFYEVAAGAVAKLTHIVGNGQPNKIENVSLNTTPLLPFVSGTVTPFYGAYNNSWDNPTWMVNSAVNPEDDHAVTTVIPNSTNSGCVTWGAVVMSTTVPDADNDGLLDKWETNQGYTDAATQKWVPLPGADPNKPDIFAEVDYLSNLDGGAGPYLHSHLPKQAALDKVGGAFAAKGINIHFDVGVEKDSQGNIHPIYPTAMSGSGPDPYIIPYNATTGAGTGGNAIPESVTVCTDSSSNLCPFPSTQNTGPLPVVGWKEGFFYVQNQWQVTDSSGNTVTLGLGNFAPERSAAYHYVLFGHALGENRSVWSAVNANPSIQSVPYLQSIANNGDGTATVTIVSSPGMAVPGDGRSDRVIITGAFAQPALNGIYKFSSANSLQPADPTSPVTTTFVINNANLPAATPGYDYTNEPQLAVMYGGPTTSSGHSDIAGGDTMITFGLWPADDAPGCNADPAAGPPYCDNQVGNVQSQAGTLMHELGHTLGLMHGGTYYANADNSPSSVPTYGLNCKSNFLSVMNYLFQIHGFPDSTAVDYSGQTLGVLDENSLDESQGIGVAPHLTRWYGLPNALDQMLGTNVATLHCDGTPLKRDSNGNIIEPQLVRVGGQVPPASAPATAVDWNNDLIIPDAVNGPLDVNFNGKTGDDTTGDGPQLGFDDWAADSAGSLNTIGVDLRQVDARQNSAGLSGAAGSPSGVIGAGGSPSGVIGAGGSPSGVIGAGGSPSGLAGGGGTPSGVIGAGGIELDLTVASSVVDAPHGLTATWNKSINSVVLNWNQPVFGQIRAYYIYRLLGTVNPQTNPLTNATLVVKLNGAPPQLTYADKKASPNKTYTYFVVSQILDGRKSSRSNLAQVNTF